MSITAELPVLYPTSLRDAGDHAAATVARLARSCAVRVTVAHVLPPGADEGDARSRLARSLPALDASVPCTRLLLHGSDAAGALATLCATRGIDLVLAAESPRRGVARLLRRSLRARLMACCGVPVWTVRRDRPCDAPVRRIACLVDFAHDPQVLLQLAVPLARACGARLRLLHVVPPVDEGTLQYATSGHRALSRREADARLATVQAGLHGVEVERAVATGQCLSEVRHLLAGGGDDLLFLSAGSVPVWPRSLSRTLERLPCAAVCLDDRLAGPVWQLERAAPAALPHAGPAPALAR